MSLVVIVFFLTIFIPFIIKGKVSEAVHKEAENMMYAKVEFTDLRVDLIKHFPLISFNLKNILIEGTEAEFENDTLLQAKQIEICLDASSLFGNKGYEIRKIFMISPRIEAQVAYNGKVNWNIFKPDTTHQQKDPLHPSSYTSFHLKLNKIKIQNGHILFADLESMHGLECRDLNLTLKGKLFTETPELNLSCSFEEINLSNRSGKNQQETAIDFQGKIYADFPKQTFRFGKNTCSVSGKDTELKGSITINKEAFTSSIQIGPENKDIEEIFYFISTLYLKKYNMSNERVPDYQSHTLEQIRQGYLAADSILISAQKEADSIVLKADRDIRLILERADNPILRIVAEKAAKKIYDKSRKEAKEVISNAEEEANKLIPAE